MTALSMLVGVALGSALAAYVLYRNHRAELDRRRLVRGLQADMEYRRLHRFDDD